MDKNWKDHLLFAIVPSFVGLTDFSVFPMNRRQATSHVLLLKLQNFKWTHSHALFAKSRSLSSRCLDSFLPACDFPAQAGLAGKTSEQERPQKQMQPYGR